MEYVIKVPMFSICPIGHRSSFGRPMEVYMKSGQINDLEKENYWPVSILSHVSKIFERIMYMQIVEATTGGVL